MSSPSASSLPGSEDEPGDGSLTPGERSVLAALRQPGRKTVRAETTDTGVRGLEVEEVFSLTGGDESALALVRRLVAEAAFQDITLVRRDGHFVALRRVVRSRL